MRPIITIICIAALSQAIAAEPECKKQHSPEQIFTHLDADQSGGLSLSELQAKPPRSADAPEPSVKSQARHQEKLARIAEHFPTADADNSGELSLAEFTSLKTIDRTAAYNDIDADGNGMVSEDEFKAHHDAKRAQREAEGSMPKSKGEDGPADKGKKGKRKGKGGSFTRIDANQDGSISLEEWLEHKPPRRDKSCKQVPQSDG